MISKYIERVLTLLVIALVVTEAICLILFGFGCFQIDSVTERITAIYSSPIRTLAVSFAGLLLLLFCGFLIYLTVKNSLKVKTFVIGYNETGACFITKEALTKLIRHICASFGKVEACYVNIIGSDADISVGVRLIVSPDTRVQSLTDGCVNNALKQYLTDSVGLRIRDVDVLIENVRDNANNQEG